MKRSVPWVGLICLFFLLNPISSFSAEQGLSAGYGFAFLNPGKRTGHLQDSKQYDFFQLTYTYERDTGLKNLAILAEPWAAYVNRPADGADVGFNLGIKYYLTKNERWRPFVTAGVGIAYTTIRFEEQGTHLLFALQAGVGFRYKNFFIEDRMRHYSNGQTAYPNRSVHANIIAVGYYF
jgi:Lipid A 3-O-deacylase (PagL)